MAGKPGKKSRQKRKANPKARLISFAYGGLDPRLHISLLEELKLWPELLPEVKTAWQTAWLSRTRSIAASDFLREPSSRVGDVLLMVDRDMMWRPGDALHLAEKALETRGVVGAAYARRDFNIGLAPHINEPGVHRTGEDKLVGAEFIGTGFCAIHREALERMALVLPLTAGGFWPFFINVLAPNPRDARRITTSAYFPMFAKADGVLDPRSDDVTFSKYARQSGSSVKVAMYPQVHHIGDYAYRPVDAQTPPPPNTQAVYIVAKAVDDDAFDRLPKDMADFNGDALNSIDRRMRLADQRLAGMYLQDPPRSFADKLEWYKREDVGRESIYSQARLALGMADVIEGELGDVDGLKVLDWGSGIGTIALYLAERGCDVWCVEPSETLRGFMEMRAERLGVSDRIHWYEEGEHGQRAFDMAVAWHVFEHVANPDWLLKRLSQALKMGGSLITSFAFGPTQTHPMNQGHPNWPATLQAHGLVAKEGSRHALELPDDFVNLRMRAGFAMQTERASLTGQPGLFNGVYEPELSEMLRTVLRPGDVFFDVGANVGYFSLLASPLCAKVVAVEPSPRALEALAENVGQNGLENVVIEGAAVDSRSGRGRLVTDTPYTLTHHLGAAGGVPVSTVTLRELMERHGKPRIVKMDIEGAEGLAMEPLTREDMDETEWVFFEYHPEFLADVSGMADPEDLLRRIEGLGFELVAPGSRAVISVEEFGRQFKDLQGKQGVRYVNMYARRRR